MLAAFYIGNHKADAGWRARVGVVIIRLAQYGAKFADTTHCEVVLEQYEDGECLIGSSTMIPENKTTGGNGVRTKRVALTAGNWRVYDVPNASKEHAVTLFKKEDGKRYDLFGAIASAVNIFLSKGWFCSKITAEAFGIIDGGQFTPAELEAVIASIGTDVTSEFFKGTYVMQ